MTERREAVESILTALQERTKELNCLYAVEKLLHDTRSSLDATLQRVIEIIPTGWQYAESCQARILLIHGRKIYQPGNFVKSRCVLNAPILVNGEPYGTLEVSYKQEMPEVDEGPFLKDERRLLDSLANRLGYYIAFRELASSMREWKTAREKLARDTISDWVVVIDLLRRTDMNLLMRVTRKMINHLCWSGVKEAEALLVRREVRDLVDRQNRPLDDNRPSMKAALPSYDTLVEEAFRVAATHLSDDEIIACIQKWIKQDRASFMINTLENYHTSLVDVADAINRYQHATHGEIELETSTLKGLRVNLIRRLLSDQLEYINVAKEYFDIKDFHELLQQLIFPAEGHGRVGGKAAGLLLAYQIVKQHTQPGDLLADIKVPRTWVITSDGIYNFVYSNHLEDIYAQKYKDIDQIRQEYPDIVQVFKHSRLSSEIQKGLSLVLDELGERPLIVRSSSLLEDRFGAAFSGKYKSLFLANQGSKQQRLDALGDAIAEVYASIFGPDPIEYRAERNLLDFQEGMGILIQEVVGTKVGHYFLPAFAGVVFSRNEFRWSPRIKREDGLVRMVPGLGTRAVDRLSDDYPILVCPGQPNLRTNATADEIVRYSPRYLDVINLKTNQLESVGVSEFLRENGGAYPLLESVVSVFEHERLRQPLIGQVDCERDDLIVTFEGLLHRTPFLKQVHALLQLLQEKMATPVDIEFAHDGRSLYLLQCRAQNPGKYGTPAAIPRDLPRDRVLFSADRYISNGTVPNVTHVVYVDPGKYSELESREKLLAVGRAVGRLNKLLPKHQFILMGPGRWGSRGDIKLGVNVTYSDINNTAMLIEIARRKGDYTPDLSFGTHFFQDLVESSIRYLPLYPDEEGAIFNEPFLTRSGNVLPELAPEFADLSQVLYVIDVPRAADGQLLHVLMNADLNEAVGVLIPSETAIDAFDATESAVAPQRGQHWRWRLHMAENIAAQLDPLRFGVQAFYVFGSTKNATAGPASDIDVLIHFRGTRAQREALEGWLEGWSLCLAELNYLRTGYKTEGLLDAHIITDEDIAKNTSYAVKINAVTDAARALPLKQ